MTGNGTERVLGKLLQSVEDLRGDVSRLEGKIDAKSKDHEKRLSDVEGHINRQKGGYLTLLGLTGLAGTIGGLIGNFWKG